MLTTGLSALLVGGLGSATPPARGGYRVESGTFRTPRWPGQRVGWTLARPQTVRGTVVALHGMGGHGSDWLGVMHVEDHLRGTGLAVVGVDGAAAYWHPREVGPYAGSDTAAMVIEDVLPLAARLGLPVRRVGFLGMSMGGFGSLFIASLLGPTRVFGVATLAAALRTSGNGTYPERFDDADDYRRHDVFLRTATLRGIPVWLACGDRDRFRAGNEAFARRVPWAVTMFDEGDHEDRWFRTHLGAAVRFLSDHAAA